MNARWERIQQLLAAEGIDIRVDARPYQEAVYGRVRSGTSYSARLVLPDGRHVTVRDQWWRKNPDVWIGYLVSTETAEGIVTRDYPLTKKRSEVVAFVREAVA